MRPIEPLTRDECYRFLAKFPRSRLGCRDRALVSLLWRSQLRISEALSLELDDYDSDRSLLNVRHGKGDKQRMAVLHRAAQADLEVWLQERKKLKCFCKKIFVTMRGKPVDRKKVHRMMQSAARRAGITKRVHPHGFRHTGAMHLAESGVPINVISAQLGHASISTTHHYLQILCPSDRSERLQEAEL